MYRVMTDEEMKASEERVRRYRESDSTEDQIAGILMDTSVAGFGMNEGPAKEKAKVIWRLITEL
jgi:hypothetical protein